FTSFPFVSPPSSFGWLRVPNAAIDPRAITVIDESRAIASRVESLVGQHHDRRRAVSIRHFFWRSDSTLILYWRSAQLLSRPDRFRLVGSQLHPAPEKIPAAVVTLCAPGFGLTV